MDFVILSTVKSSVLDQRRLFGFVNVLSESVVEALDQFWHYQSCCDSNIRHDRVNDHGLDDLEAHVQIPLRHVVMVWSLHVLCDQCWLVLCCLGVH